MKAVKKLKKKSFIISLLKNKNLKTNTLSELKSDKNSNLSKLVKKDNPLNKKYETLIDREMNEVADGNT